MTKILIPATNSSPQITLADIRAAGQSSEDMVQMRHVINNCASQIGQSECAAAFAELDRIEREFDN
jgi:hypothetical protein